MIVTLLISTFATILLIPLFSRTALRLNIGLDMPDGRKVHDHPIPRVGGIAIALAVYGSTVFLAPQGYFLKAYAISGLFIVFFGMIDDFKGIDFRFKFLIQTVAAIVMVIYGGIKIKSLGGLLPDDMLLPDAVAIPLTVVAIVGVTNAVNLADGLDGLAGGICLLSFCCLAYLAYLEEDLTSCLLALALAGALFGFLSYNTYPAKLFMGDTGSQFLGFSAISLSLRLTQGETAVSPLLPLLIIGFPVLDTFVVMAQRLAEKRPIFSPDRNHFHHRLMELGLFHTESVLVVYSIQALLVTAAFVFRFRAEWFLLAAYILFAAAILTGFHVAEKRRWRLPRYHFFDTIIKGRLRSLREQGAVIKVCFGIIRFGVPFLLFVSCLVPSEIPFSFSLLCTALMGVLLIVWRFKKDWMRGCLTVILYLFIPLIVSLGVEKANDTGSLFSRLHSLSHIVLVFFVVLTLKFTRRERGFRTTPMDFLVLFIALVVPHVLSGYLHTENLSAIAATTMVFYFSYEVLMGELRGKLTGLAAASTLPFLIVIARGFLRR
ncbi:MAG: MraY family glycosyltransferase [Syntrophorhabdales bacterium]|jgi:UDP-GlcNAc:undecaprenyl-phosphate GlcNAc-1-phosphate transferase